jgi:DNA polymerase-3 subunit beta
MATATKKLMETSSVFGVVVPGRSLLELGKLLEENDEPIRIYVQKNFLMAHVGDTKIITRLLGTDKEFVNYKQIIPTSATTQLIVNKAQLESALERAAILARQNNDNSVKFTIKENLLTLTARAEIGNVTENVTVSLQGNDLMISFDSFFFRECLRSVKDEYVKLKLNSSINPCVIVPSDENNSYLFIILPVKSTY